MGPPIESTMTSAPLPSVNRRTSVDEIGRGVVDAVVEPEVDQAVETAVARRGGQHRGPGPLGQLDGGDPDAAGSGVDQRGLSGLEAAELEQAVVGGAEGDGNAGRLLGAHAIGNDPAERFGHRPECGVGSVQAHGDHPVPR